MKPYLSYFKLKYATELQYRIAAMAGLSTQFFFGFVYVSIYIAFYESGGTNLPMSLEQLVSYIWLEQAFFVLIYSFYKDKEIINMIKSGNVSYELSRPQDLYFMWMARIYGDKLSKTSLRFLPVIIVACLLPRPYKLNLITTPQTFLIFIISLILASVLVTTIALLMHIICLFTLDDKGIVNIFMVVSDLLSGLVIPIPFFPKYLQNISNFLPFRYVSDFIFRLYVGNISNIEGIFGIFIQLIWIIILIILGKTLINKALKKAVIQGG